MDDLVQPNIEEEAESSGNGLALAAMITGIVGLILSFIPLIGFLSWIICPIAAVLGFIALGKSTGKGMAITGIVTGILGVLVCIAWITIFAAVGSAVNDMAGGDEVNAEAILEKLEELEEE